MRTRCANLNCYVRLLICILACVCVTPVLAQTVYSDANFDVASDWSVFGPLNVPSTAQDGAFSAQQGSGPDPFMEVRHTRATVSSGGVATWGMIINNTFVWDPAEDADGPLGKVELTMFIAGGGAWSLAVKQGDDIWFATAKRAILNLPDPLTIEISNLAESDFFIAPGFESPAGDQPERPDFSANAPPISFGIGVGWSCPESSNCANTAQRVMEIDDLQVTAYSSVPLTPGHNGNWWAGPERNGEGVQAEIIDAGGGNLLFVATIYSYHPMSGQIFMIAVGPVDGDVAEVDVFITDGGRWGAAFDPDDVVESQWGSGRFLSCGCSNMVMDLRPNSELLAQGFTNLLNYELVRLTTPVPPCPFEGAD